MIFGGVKEEESEKVLLGQELGRLANVRVKVSGLVKCFKFRGVSWA